MGKSKQSIASQLDTLYQFSAEQIENRPADFTYSPRLIDSPSFFTVKKLQEYLNNPLLTPEWFNLIFNNQLVPLEDITFHRIAQSKELRFMDKKSIDDFIERGAAVVLEGIEIMNQPINEFIRRIDELQPCASSNSVAFFSQKQQEAYGGHRDSDDVLVIQLAGKKVWKIFEPQQRRYLGNTPLSMEQMGPLAAEITMSPGDAIFLRAGVPHIVHTPHNYSLHLAFDIKDRSLNVEQITSEANNRYNHACADSFASAAEVVKKYSDLLNSNQFQADLNSANENNAQEIKNFRQHIGQVSSISSLSRFIK